MADKAIKDRLQPSLLDRLRDDAPHQRKESREARVLTNAQLRETVRRDLAWLLNTDNMESVHDLDRLPYVAESVLNFGLPSMAGTTASSADVHVLESRLRRIILDFEPRILPESLRVFASVDDNEMSQNSLTFEIQGELYALPLPLEMYLKTQLDLETGHATILDVSR